MEASQAQPTHCSEVYDKLQQLVDCECNESDRDNCLKHIEDCPECMEIYNNEKAFREFVHNKCKCKEAPTELIEKILKNIKERG